jgi:hypothetical protein
LTSDCTSENIPKELGRFQRAARCPSGVEVFHQPQEGELLCN